MDSNNGCAFGAKCRCNGDVWEDGKYVPRAKIRKDVLDDYRRITSNRRYVVKFTCVGNRGILWMGQIIGFAASGKLP